MAKRGRPRKNAPKVTKAKKVDEIDHTQTPEAIEFDREMAIKNGEAVEKSLLNVMSEQNPDSKVTDPKVKPKVKRFTGSHQVCPRCGATDTTVYKSMPVDERTMIRVQYRRCQRAVCRAEFKATLKVV